MFVPRALRLKGVKEPKKAPKPAATELSAEDASEVTRKSNATTILNDDHLKNDQKTKSGDRFTTQPATPEYLQQLACGVELLFTDYAHQNKDGSAWLEKHYRDVEGESKFIHLSAVLDHPNISSLKPTASHAYLQQALRDHSSPYLESAENGYFVRRRPSTFPLKFLPNNSFNIVDDNGLSFWDQRTIYIEPHTRDLCKTPAKVAHWLKEHGALREKWLPVQAIHSLYNSCAFVVLSGNVTHEGMWQKWRETGKPEYWKTMTKVEHTKRTKEYVELLKIENPSAASKSKERTDETTTVTHEASNHKTKRVRKKKSEAKMRGQATNSTEIHSHANTPAAGERGESQADEAGTEKEQSAHPAPTTPNLANVVTEDTQEQEGPKKSKKKKRPRKRNRAIDDTAGTIPNVNQPTDSTHVDESITEAEDDVPSKKLKLTFHEKPTQATQSVLAEDGTWQGSKITFED